MGPSWHQKMKNERSKMKSKKWSSKSHAGRPEKARVTPPSSIVLSPKEYCIVASQSTLFLIRPFAIILYLAAAISTQASHRIFLHVPKLHPYCDVAPSTVTQTRIFFSKLAMLTKSNLRPAHSSERGELYSPIPRRCDPRGRSLNDSAESAAPWLTCAGRNHIERWLRNAGQRIWNI